MSLMQLIYIIIWVQLTLLIKKSKEYNKNVFEV